VFMRVAEFDGVIYLDLGNPDWEVAAVTPEGWSLLSNCPVKFRRPKGMLALPQPVRGGNLAELRPFLNLPAGGSWVLVVGWLVGGMRPSIPCPILVLYGEQGSAKSTAARLLRSVYDPALPALRSGPHSERDLMIGANNVRVLAFDNLSYLPAWFSDALCRLAT